MRVVETRDKKEWNEFLERNDGPVYNRYEWGQACERYGHKTKILVAKEGGEIVAGLPLVYMRSRLFGNKLVSMPYSEYGSVVCAEDAPSAAIQRLLEETKRYADRLKTDFVSLRGNSLGERSDFVEENRFVSFEVPLEGSEEDCWMRLDSERRRQVRRARERDIDIDVVNSEAGLKRYYDLYLRAQRGHGSPPHSFEFFRYLWKTLGSGGPMAIELVTKDGRAINGNIRFEFGDTIYGWCAINDYEYRDLGGGSLLAWNEIETTRERGYEQIYLGRTQKGTGVYQYKKSFGGTEVPLTDVHYFPNGTATLPNANDTKYDRVKQAWRRTPISVTRSVGPHLRANISL